MIIAIKSQFELTILTFDKIYPRRLFPAKNKKSEHHHWVLQFQISLSTKFQRKLSILIFCTKFSQKEYFWS